MAKKIPIAVVLLAAGFKAAREGKDRDTAKKEIMAVLPAIDYEIDHSASETDLVKTQQTFDLGRLSVE